MNSVCRRDRATASADWGLGPPCRRIEPASWVKLVVLCCGGVWVRSVGGGVAHALRGGRGPEEAKIYGAQRAGLGKLPQEKPREKESLGIE